ncbi:MAG TPA: YncE family protein, partial [Candidatus Binatia bacterium]|nr:YncE family protein [Candidatus Binatia bacterium]
MGLLFAASSIIFWLACGQVYRPVVIPCSGGISIPGCPVQPPPVPSNFHQEFAITANVPGYPGGAMQIDVSGDSVLAETPTSDKTAPNLGDVPTHAAILSNNTRVFVASAGSTQPGGIDVVSSFSPAAQTSAGNLGAVVTVNMPLGSQPAFLNSTENAAMYVANFGNNTVSAINTNLNVVSNTATVGTNPVSLAETIKAPTKLYVANQGSSTISSLNTADLSANTVTGFTGQNPVWVVARDDSAKVYVLTQGDGTLVTIDVATDTVTSSLSVGAGANFLYYDPHLNRLYVTNPVTNTVLVFSDTSAATDVPTQLASISFALGATACPTGPSACSPISITALPDGSRFYVATLQTSPSCPDPVFVGLYGAAPCVIPGLAVFDAAGYTLKTA